MARGGPRPVPDVMDEGPFQRPDGGVLAEPPGEGLQYRQVRRAFEIEHPSGLLGLVVLVESDLRERLAQLAPPVDDPVRFADEGDDQVPVGGFVQEHLRVAGRDDLGAAVRGDLGYQAVCLALAEDFEMRVGFVQQDDRAGVGVHVGEDQEGLLQSPPARREVEGHAALAVPHGDLPPLRHVAGLVERRPEERLDPRHQRVPPVGRLVEDAEAQVAEDFGRAAFAYPHVHGALVEPRLGGGEAGHGEGGRRCGTEPAWSGTGIRSGRSPSSSRRGRQ